MTDEELISRLRDACRGGDGCKCSLSEAADRIEALVRDRRWILDERDRTFALMLARAEAAEAQNGGDVAAPNPPPPAPPPPSPERI